MSVEIPAICNKCVGIPSGACYVYDNPKRDCGRTYFSSSVPIIKKQGYFDTIPSVQTIPARWSITIGVDSIDWITFCWYRWRFDKGEGLMLSKTYEWNLRRFWKVSVEP